MKDYILFHVQQLVATSALATSLMYFYEVFLNYEKKYKTLKKERF